LDVPEQDTTWKQPEVFLEFERLHLLVEAKLTDAFNQQSPGQWAGELAAYLQREKNDYSMPVWLLAIGGVGEAPTRTMMAPMQQEAERLLLDAYPNMPVRLATCSWRRLLVALIEEGKYVDPRAGMGLDFIITDLIGVLGFHGIRHTFWLRDLLRPEVQGLRLINDRAATTLVAWTRLCQTVVLTERASWFVAPDLLGIRAQSILTWGKIIDGYKRRDGSRTA
jgi:hypothetical protein